MSYLNNVRTGFIKENDFELLFGVPKIGKTTFACAREGVILMDIENGSRHLNVTRLPKVQNFNDVMAQVDELLTTEHPYKTLVVDSLDHLELLVNQAAIEEFSDGKWRVLSDGAFGKGGDAARYEWQKFIQLLKKLRDKMDIVLICHSQLRTIADPMKSQPYDKFDLKLQDKTSALFKESVDAILFLTYDIILNESSQKGGKAKTVAPPDGAKRVILTQGRPSHEGGNRYGLPYKIPLDYEAYKAARKDSNLEDPEILKTRTLEAIANLTDEETKKKAMEAVEKQGGNVQGLMKILNRVQTILENAA